MAYLIMTVVLISVALLLYQVNSYKKSMKL